MKIKYKLLIGFGLLMAIMLLLTMLGYNRLNYMQHQLDRIYEERYLKVRHTSNMRGEVNDIARKLNNMMLNNKSVTPNDESEIREMISNADGYLKQIQAAGSSTEEKQMIEAVVESWAGYLRVTNQGLDYLAKGQLQEAINYRNNLGLPIQQEAIDYLNSLGRYQDLRIGEEVEQVRKENMASIQLTTIVMVIGLLLGLGIIMWVIPSITRGFNVVSMMISSFGQGRIKTIRRLKVKSKDEIGEIATVFKTMAENLEEKRLLEESYLQAQKDQNWLNSHVSRVTELLRGIHSLEQVSQMFISEFTPVVGAHYGAIYIQGDDANRDRLKLFGSYAKEGSLSMKEIFDVGEGMIGQSALDKKPIVIREVPPNYIAMNSALGSAPPAGLAIYPIVFEEELLGVIEMATFTSFTELHQQLLSELANGLGIILNNINRRLKVEELLRESQALTEELQCQSEELQTQQEELRRSNENLEEQTDALKRSEELLQRQQEELEHYNTELIAKTKAMEEQMQELEEKNYQIEKTSTQLEQQAAQLALTTKYKSEFMANMSHELRTPLNSLLILSQLLSENKDSNLTPKQVEYAQTIYMSGSDLLKMIDEILDLSKVDAGKMEINQEHVRIKEWASFIEQSFLPMANKKDLQLNIHYAEDIPAEIVTDGHRTKQIIRNMMSNALKFTNEGSVNFTVQRANPDDLPYGLDEGEEYIAVSVKDTGIGIPADKRDLIFEAFQQVDGTTSRKYGGTGLGLSISRELARLLGGLITVESTLGEGSCFTLYLPLHYQGAAQQGLVEAAVASTSESKSRENNNQTKPIINTDFVVKADKLPDIKDDRESIEANDKVLLIIEDDPKFARILLDMARGRGFKALVAMQGDIGLQMAQSYLPDAIILDIQLPVLDGWSILGELKSSSSTRHIPVHIVSVVDEVKQGLRSGALAYLRKPSSRAALDKAFADIESYSEKSVKYLLIVEDDEIQQSSIIELIGHDDVAITAVGTGREALEELRKQHYDCMVLDLMLSDMTGFELLDHIREDEALIDLPIIIYTGKELDSKEEMLLRKYAESIIIKDVKSPERLLDETTLFLHRVEANLPEDKRKILQKLHNKELLFEGKKILLVDDDIRNVFALSSVLEGYDMEVVFAENGREAIELLQQHGDFDLVLMDMMMPEMDGYEAMQRIRQMPEFYKLPIIALTAKAMKEDRSKCIEAGASDYVKKPIQTEQLLSLMRVWLYS